MTHNMGPIGSGRNDISSPSLLLFTNASLPFEGEMLLFLYPTQCYFRWSSTPTGLPNGIKIRGASCLATCSNAFVGCRPMNASREQAHFRQVPLTTPLALPGSTHAL